ncbi:MAG: CBS domain-containing protein [Lewinellaceae bacterium]|nr:CBS domain-containing protein [Saprospiraceae bacterium]MCB9340509.1 CBS domain-containing protein [Lewinellaceae bacterium]
MFDKTITVSEIMTTDVIILSPNDTMEKVADIFRMNNIHHIPILDDNGKVVGIISQNDYHKILHGFTLFKTEKSEEYNKAILRSLLVKEVMTKQVAKLNPQDKLTVAASYFRENLFHAIPVVDRQGKLVGIVTTFDLLNYAYREELLLN